MDEQRLNEIKAKAEKFLFKIPGVHAVGLGSRFVKGEPTGELAIQVYVTKKLPPRDIPPSEIIPSDYEGIKIDVIESQIPEVTQSPGANPSANLVDDGRYRPLQGGTQINRTGQGFGTLGCFATVVGDPGRVIGISNHHVVYGCNNPSATASNEIVGQASGSDSCSGCCKNVIGKAIEAQVDADVDIALIELDPGLDWLAEVRAIGNVTGTRTVTPAEAMTARFQVQKHGRTTQLTGGTVQSVSYSGTIRCHDGTTHRSFVSGMLIRPNPDPAIPAVNTVFSSPGDSGSAVLAGSQVSAILFGANLDPAAAQFGFGFAIPIQTVLNKFSTGLPAARRIRLQIATASTTNDVRTVPGTARVVAAEDPADTAAVARVRSDLAESPLGRDLIMLFERHHNEVQNLINNERRTATVWHRSGAAAVFHSLVRAFKVPNYRVPETIDGRPVTKCLDQFEVVLRRFGSYEMIADIDRFRDRIPMISGQTYAEILDSIAADERSLTMAPA